MSKAASSAIKSIVRKRFDDIGDLENQEQFKWQIANGKIRCCPSLNVAPPSWRLFAGWKPAPHPKLGQHPKFKWFEICHFKWETI
jgi:hypothetical protein